MKTELITKKLMQYSVCAIKSIIHWYPNLGSFWHCKFWNFNFPGGPGDRTCYVFLFGLFSAWLIVAGVFDVLSLMFGVTCIVCLSVCIFKPQLLPRTRRWPLIILTIFAFVEGLVPFGGFHCLKKKIQHFLKQNINLIYAGPHHHKKKIQIINTVIFSKT